MMLFGFEPTKSQFNFIPHSNLSADAKASEERQLERRTKQIADPSIDRSQRRKVLYFGRVRTFG